MSNSNVSRIHEPVLKEELLHALITDSSGTYVDATFGRGGHADAMLQQLSHDGRLIAIDQDLAAREVAQEIESSDSRFRFYHHNFGEISKLLCQMDVGQLTGLYFDVGVSTPQLKDPERGFGFDVDGDLDMRMDSTKGEPASKWLNRCSVSELAEILRVYGDVRGAQAMARHIVSMRPLRRTSALAEAVKTVLGNRQRPARLLAQVFQAIRIHINDELSELERGLTQGFELLKTGGRLAVITFHSLEHRLVRACVSEWINPVTPRGLPLKNEPTRARYVSKNVRPTYAERQRNPSARSAMMQVVERLD